MLPAVVFFIRVTSDEKHAIYEQDFEAFEEFVIRNCLADLNEPLDISVVFREVDDEDE